MCQDEWSKGFWMENKLYQELCFLQYPTLVISVILGYQFRKVNFAENGAHKKSCVVLSFAQN